MSNDKTKRKKHAAPWVNPKHTVAFAARRAAGRDCHLEISWTVDGGLRVVAIDNKATPA